MRNRLTSQRAVAVAAAAFLLLGTTIPGAAAHGHHDRLGDLRNPLVAKERDPPERRMGFGASRTSDGTKGFATGSAQDRQRRRSPRLRPRRPGQCRLLPLRTQLGGGLREGQGRTWGQLLGCTQAFYDYKTGASSGRIRRLGRGCTTLALTFIRRQAPREGARRDRYSSCRTRARVGTSPATDFRY